MRASPRRPVVAHLTRYVADYRAPYFACLREMLREHGADFRLVHGQPGPVDAPRNDAVTLPFAEHVRNRYLLVRGREVCWQPYLHLARDVDLAILDQGARLLATYALLARRRFGGPAVALWGHGLHFDAARALPVTENLKGCVARQADWWFPYTERSVEVVRSLGVPRERITCMENAIDTQALQRWAEGFTQGERDCQAAALDVHGGNVAVFTGALYPERRLDLLVEAGDLLAADLQGFHVIVIGDGHQRTILEEAARSRPWLHLVGARFGREKALIMSLARVLVIPGAVGLGILDGFALGLPLVTVQGGLPTHELSYLRDGQNGVLVRRQDAADLAAAVSRILTDEPWREHLRQGCRAAAERYTIENMAQRVCDGCLEALRRLGRMPA